MQIEKEEYYIKLNLIYKFFLFVNNINESR